MIRVEREHRFDVSLREGFDYITNPANWPAYWPGFVRIEPGWRWKEPGDETRLVVRLLGREVELRMTLTRLDRYRLVEYTTVQRGLPDARHERHFGGGGGGFQYRLVVEFNPRAGLRGVYDRTLVRRGVERALRSTVESLQQELQRGSANEGDSPPR